MTSVLDSLQPQGELHTVHSDRMDAKMFNDIKEQSSNLQQAENAGTQVLNTFPPLVQDIWSAMFKFSPEFKKPEEMSPSHRLNATLMEKMLQMPQYRELRVHTRLDDLNSAVATITIAEELTKKLKEELKEQAEHANKAQDMQEQLQKAMDAAQTYQDMADKSGNEDFQKKADQMLAKAKKCKVQLTEAEAQLEQSCNANANKIRSGMRAAAESALKNAQSTSEAVDGWGLGGGELHRMPIQQKLELAKKLQSEKFKRMAQVIGRMRRLAVHQQKTKLSQSRDEIHTVGIGNDLSRVLPAELVQLRHPLMKGEFKRKFIEGKLMQYELKGTEKQGKGPIICAVDNCLHPDTPILMADGTIRRIQGIKEGDMVLSFSFEKGTTVPQRVGKVAQTKAPERLLRIATPEGSIVCTPEHKFFVCQDNGVLEIRAADLKGGDLITSPRRLPEQLHREDGHLWAQLIGYLLGDGNKWHDKNRGSKSIQATDKDIEHIKHYADIASRIGFKPLIRHWGDRNRLCINSARLYDTIESQLPGLLSRSPQRIIHERIFGWSNELLSSFIRSLYDAEGCVADHQILFITSSRNIVDGLQTLLKRFGIITEKGTQESGFSDHEYHRLMISDRQSIESFATLIGFSGSKKRERLALILKRRKQQGGRAQVVPINLRAIVKVARSIGVVYGPKGSRGFGAIQYNQRCKNVSRARVRQITSDIELHIQELQTLAPETYNKELRFLTGLSHNAISKGTGLTIKQLKRLTKGFKVRSHREIVLEYILQETKRRITEAELYLRRLKPIISDDIFWTEVQEIKEVESEVPILYDLTMDGKWNNYLTLHYIVHNSGSMAGDREIWSKAVALALLEIATMQKRAFVCIHFGGPLDELKVVEVTVGDKNILTKAVEIAEFFLDSDGTAFEPALTRAAESVASQAYQKADVVFITDGKAPIAPKFLADFLDLKRRREFRVFGVPIQSHDVATLKKFSDELIRVNELLDAEAEPLLEI